MFTILVVSWLLCGVDRYRIHGFLMVGHVILAMFHQGSYRILGLALMLVACDSQSRDATHCINTHFDKLSTQRLGNKEL